MLQHRQQLYEYHVWANDQLFTHLLLETDATLKEIAEGIGYQDPKGVRA
ncbi:hypothetical protein NST07_33630 [Paenibacillus sp. FSL L8-0340]